MMQEQIPLNMPAYIEGSCEAILDSLKSGRIAGRGLRTTECENWIVKNTKHSSRALLTTSCTHALELSAILMEFKKGDEVIVPSYTFVSSALAFYMHGARVRFCDIRKDTLNIDENLIEQAITKRTKAIVVVHYAGVACEMDKIMSIAAKYGILVIEDNAHGFLGKYKGVNLGSIGDFGTLSFHETKNISCGEGGAILLNNNNFLQRAEILIEKGTNRSQFISGQIDKYSWVDKGSSYVLSDLLASLLYSQLRNSKEIQFKRQSIWERYFSELSDWALDNEVLLPFVPDYCDQTYHMFYMLMPSLTERSKFIKYLSDHNVSSAFHYVPLHNSIMGSKLAPEDQVKCPVSEEVSTRLVRLPMFCDLSFSNQKRVINTVRNFSV